MSKISSIDEMFNDDKFSIEDAKNLVNKIDFIEKNAESFKVEYFQNVIRDVDLRREMLKDQIDNYSDELIASLKQKQKEFINLTKESNEITENIEKSKIKLDTFIQKNKDYKNKIKDFDDKFLELKHELETSLAEYKNVLTENHLSFNFYEMPIQDIFGVLDVRHENVIYL
jgi:hypothetical protein